MSDVRCRGCGAAVPNAAQWCSLCFADLRPPAPVREPVSVPAPPVADTTIVAPPVSVPASAAALPLPTLPPAAAVPSSAKHAAPALPEATWPCPRCSAPVPLSLDACEACGAGFLAGATTAMAMRLPVVGDVGKMSRGQRMLVGSGIAVVMMVLLVMLATVGAHLF